MRAALGSAACLGVIAAGPGSALKVATEDLRFDAVIDLDGGLGVPLAQPFPQPVLA